MDELTKQLTRIADALEHIAQQGGVEHKINVVVDDRKSKLLKGAVTATIDDDIKGGAAFARVLTGG